MREIEIERCQEALGALEDIEFSVRLILKDMSDFESRYGEFTKIGVEDVSNVLDGVRGETKIYETWLEQLKERN